MMLVLILLDKHFGIQFPISGDSKKNQGVRKYPKDQTYLTKFALNKGVYLSFF